LLQNKLDGMGDTTTLMQMRIQKYLDAFTKMFEMLSNALKKIAKTASDIIGHLK